MNKAVIYTRVSTKKQIDALDSQYNLLTSYIYRNRLFLENYYSDVGSGTDLTNLNINNLLNHKNSLILVRDISRLGRNQLQVTNLLKGLNENNNRVYSVIEEIYNDDPYFIERVKEADRNLTVQKNIQKESIRYIRENGGYIGKAPYGYQVININNIPKLIKFEPEYKNVKKIVNLIDLGIPVNMVVERLNEIEERKGNKDKIIIWTCKKVKSIYEKEKNNIL